MQRRAFISGVGAASAPLWLPGYSRAGQSARAPLVGFISSGDVAAAADFLGALRAGLTGYGYTEPRTLAIASSYANYDLNRIPASLEEMEQRRVDIIVTHAAATLGVVKGKRTIPAVYELSADPVTMGMASSLARPDFNATGITLMRAELNRKRLELAHEIFPDARRVAVVYNPLHAGEHLERDELEVSARQFGIEISYFPTPNAAELDRALAAITAQRQQILLALSDGFVVQNRRPILELAMKLGIPVVSGWAVMAKSGALFTYGPRLVESYRRSAYFVDRILKGAKPADLPIEQPTILELVVNLRTAKALGISMPVSLLARADDVLE